MTQQRQKPEPIDRLRLWLSTAAAATIRRVERFSEGPYWVLRVTAAATLLTLLYACPPYEILEPEPHEWQARRRHIQQPFHDPAKEIDSRHHDAKRTFRIAVPLIAHFLHLDRYGVIGLMYLAGLGIFGACTLAVYRITLDRTCATMSALVVATIPTGALSFWDFQVYFYDNVALFGLTAALACRWPAGVLALTSLAAWTDERGLAASSLVLLFFVYEMIHSGSSIARRSAGNGLLAVVLAWMLYFLGRAYLSYAFGFRTASGDVGIYIARQQVNLFSVAAWGGLEGGWFVVAAAGAMLFGCRHPFAITIAGARISAELLFGISFVLSVTIISGIACSVFDLTRSFAYTLPAMLLSIRILVRYTTNTTLRLLLLLAFATSFFWLNLVITGPGVVHIMKPAPLKIPQIISALWLSATPGNAQGM